MRIAVTGGTGFIGNALVPELAARGDTVLVFSRTPAMVQRLYPAAQFPAVEAVGYTPLARGQWAERLSGCEAVVHLAGAPINGRWSGPYKRAMRDSRWTGTRVLVDAMRGAADRPRVLVSMSAARHYGPGESTMDEDTPPPTAPDLLATITRGWEAEAQRAAEAGVRTVILRAGVVLALGDGIRRALPILRRFAGGRVGSGRQWFSWVHRADVVAAILRALDDQTMQGIYNATAPEPVRMDDFTTQLGDILGSRARVPVPGFIIEQFLGDGATIVLDGQRVVPKRLTEAGFAFRYPTLPDALREMF